MGRRQQMCISFFDVVSINEQKQVSESVYGNEVEGVLVFGATREIGSRKKVFRPNSSSHFIIWNFEILESCKQFDCLVAILILLKFVEMITKLVWNTTSYFIMVGKDEIPR